MHCLYYVIRLISKIVMKYFKSKLIVFKSITFTESTFFMNFRININ